MSDDYQNESYINLPLVKMNKRRRKYCMKTALCEPPEEITKFRDLSHFSLSEGNSTSCWFFDWAIWQTRWQVTAEKTAGVRHYPSFIWKNSIVSLTLQCSSTCWSIDWPNKRLNEGNMVGNPITFFHSLLLKAIMIFTGVDNTSHFNFWLLKL